MAEAPPPTLSDPERVRFVALGDVGRGTATQRRVAEAVAAVCAERGCDLVVLLGDNLYPDGMEAPDDPRMDERIGDMYAGAGAPLYLVLGNHDYGKGRDAERAGWQVAWATARDAAELPANAWWTETGPALFVGLDTNAAFQFGAGFQSRWLADRLAESDARWKIVLGHHPFRSDGPHGNAGAYEGWSSVPVMSGGGLATLFEERLCGAADLYLAGHDHLRELIDHCGVALVVSGAGAKGTEVVDRGNHPRFASAEPGFAWIELRGDGGTVEFYDQDGARDGFFALQP